MKKLLLGFAFSIAAGTLSAQPGPNMGTTSVGSTSTDGDQSSLQGTFKYDIPFDESFITRFDPTNNYARIAVLSPEVFLNLSEGPQFNSIVFKFSGNILGFRTQELDGRIRADTSLIHVFPLAVGFETDQSFDNAALLLEAGYVPFSLSSDQDRIFQLGVNPKLGIFAQAGHKFGISSESDTGAAADQSSEASDSELARLRLSLADLSIPLVPFLSQGNADGSASDLRVTALASADLWYDLLNDEVYYRTVATVRVGLGENQNLDFKYEDGSGAPNFSEGSQFGVFITTTF